MDIKHLSEELSGECVWTKRIYERQRIILIRNLHPILEVGSFYEKNTF